MKTITNNHDLHGAQPFVGIDNVDNKDSKLQKAIPCYKNITTSVKLKGRDIKVHGFNTGTVAVKSAFLKKSGPGLMSKINILFDSTFTQYLPIWVWLIEHPEGLILIDTGENQAITNIGRYLAGENRFQRYAFENAAKFSIQKEDQINFQLNRMNIELEDIKLVVLTHLHLDHTDGLVFFRKSEIIVGAKEYKHPSSNMPSTYPKWFHPNKVAYGKNRIEYFDAAYPVTSGGDLLYIPTPGHTYGHSSLIFRTDDFDILFAGDTSYQQRQILDNEIAGVNLDFKSTAKTYKNILQYAENRRTIYLPTHDPESGYRLSNKSFLL
jgi:N-acyl homoserine lactone hydrolase